MTTNYDYNFYLIRNNSANTALCGLGIPIASLTDGWVGFETTPDGPASDMCRSVLRKDMVPLTVGDRVVTTDRRAAMYGMMTNWAKGTLGLTWNEVEEVLSKTNFTSSLHKQIVKISNKIVFKFTNYRGLGRRNSK